MVLSSLFRRLLVLRYRGGIFCQFVVHERLGLGGGCVCVCVKLKRELEVTGLD